MSEMPNLLGDSRACKGGFTALVVCVCISALIMTVYSQEGSNGPVHTVRSAVQLVATPFQSLGSLIERPFDALKRTVDDANADAETLTELRNRNAYLVSQLTELEQYKSENESLKAMLGLESSLGVTGVAADVIGGSTDNWTQTITINRGSNDGIALDMPVSDGNALVGQVCSVSANSATVRLVGDPSFSVSVSVGSSGATGILSGSVDGTVRIDYVSTSAEVNVGDTVTTSGVSDVYPGGLVIGTVSSVTNEPSSLYQDIVVTPLSSASNASQVYVVTSYAQTTQTVEATEAEGQ